MCARVCVKRVIYLIRVTLGMARIQVIFLGRGGRKYNNIEYFHREHVLGGSGDMHLKDNFENYVL